MKKIKAILTMAIFALSMAALQSTSCFAEVSQNENIHLAVCADAAPAVLMDISIESCYDVAVNEITVPLQHSAENEILLPSSYRPDNAFNLTDERLRDSENLLNNEAFNDPGLKITSHCPAAVITPPAWRHGSFG